MTFTCTVADTVELLDDIIFVRRTNRTNVTCGHIFQEYSNCIIRDKKSRYKVSCGAGSSSISSKMKNYTLEIADIHVEDFTDWWCQTKSRKNHFNILTLVENSK